MSNYDLTRLGAQEFEHMVQALLKDVIGNGTVTFGAGQDGAREATFEGEAPYPSQSTRWSGRWIFQVKYHDVALLGTDKARKAVIKDLKKELEKIVNKYKHPCDNYILITNVPLTGTVRSGNIDVIAKTLTDAQRGYVKNIHVWSADEINRFLDQNESVRTKYFEFLVTGDLIAKLIAKQDAELSEVDRTIDSYVNVTFSREQNAQLDQAGDVSEDALKLQKLFFDLSTQPQEGSWHYPYDPGQREDISEPASRRTIYNTVQFLLGEEEKRVVLIGGPGEGKSTIGQYLAQLHRATLLGRLEDVAVSSSYRPAFPRLPIRVLLKDFGQWLAEHRDDDQVVHGTLEDYVCRDIARSTSRTITPTQLHQVLKDNPVLLILDGLDEVTDLTLRKTLLTRITEFTGRCEKVLDSDLQVLASTRPTGYVAQFDPRTYTHLQLVRLTAEQVRGYVQKWTKAKDLEPTKEDRVIRTVDECLSDKQISVLTSTPLQITILLLIISTSGKPQYQREALFSDYLDVIYKRETAKGRNIIESDKQLLIALHKYIGYVLHENTTRAETTGGLLAADAYSKHVEQFLRWNDPIAKSDKLRRDLLAITKEAGERLVLIIEPTEGHYGFELRSIQEYFAACHLADTSLNTQERYARFDVIARLPYWRNVALFFAGRVGNRYLGEAANIIEVCLAMNREGPGALLGSGSDLAFQLAADRSFGPNRRLQQRLVEVALSAFEDELVVRRLPTILEELQRLNAGDQQEIVLPLLKQRLRNLNVNFAGPVATVLLAIDNSDPDALAALQRMSELPSLRVEAIEIFLSSVNPDSPQSPQLATLAEKLTTKDVERLLHVSRGRQLVATIRTLDHSGVDNYVLLTAISNFPTRLTIALGMREYGDYIREQIAKPWPTGILDQVVRLLLIHTYIARHENTGMSNRPRHNFDINTISLPDSIRVGNVEAFHQSDEHAAYPLLHWLFWITHLILGDVTPTSISEFFVFFRSNYRKFDFDRLFALIPADQYPYFDLLLTAIRSKMRVPWKALEAVFQRFAGSEGLTAWVTARDTLVFTESRSRRSLENSYNYGLSGISDVKRRTAILKTFDGRFATVLADYAFWSLHSRPVSEPDQSASLDRFIESLAEDGLITSPRAQWIRRIFYGRQSRISSGQYSRLLDVLIELGCGSIKPDALATVLISAMQADELSTGQVAAVLETITLPANVPYLFVPTSLHDGPLAYKNLLEIASQTEMSSARECARLLLDSLINFRQQMRSSNDRAIIRFRGFAEFHRALVAAPERSALRPAVSLFAIRRPTAELDWELLAALILRCERAKEVDAVRSLKMDDWDDSKYIERAIRFLMELIPRVKAVQVKLILVGFLDVLISKSSQSLAEQERALGLPLREHEE